MDERILRIIDTGKEKDIQRHDSAINLGYIALSNNSSFMGYLKSVGDGLRNALSTMNNMLPDILGPGNSRIISTIVTRSKSSLLKKDNYLNIRIINVPVVDGLTSDLTTVSEFLHGLLGSKDFHPDMYIDMLIESIGDISNRESEAKAVRGKYQDELEILEKVNSEISSNLGKMFSGSKDQLPIEALIPNYTSLGRILAMLNDVSKHIELKNLKRMESRSTDVRNNMSSMLKLYSDGSIIMSANMAKYILRLTEAVLDRFAIFNDLLYLLLRTMEMSESICKEIEEN